MQEYEYIKGRFDSLCRIWNVPIRILAPDGYLGGSIGSCGLCALCSEKRACRDMVYAGKISAQLGISYIHRCSLGGVLIAGTIVRDGNVYAYNLVGPIRMWEWDNYAADELKSLIAGMRKPKLLDEFDALSAESEALIHLTTQQTRDLCQMLFDTCAAISCEGSYLSMQRDSFYVQSKLFDVVEQEKSTSADGEIEYPIKMEQELLRRVRVGDSQGAKGILNELLGKILFNGGNNIEVLKARSLELIVMISRAAVEGGAELNKLLGMNYDYISELSRLNSLEEICVWLSHALDKFMETVYGTRATPNMLLLRSAARFISNHYTDDISLEMVAENVHVSPYYLSHLFREELGITFIEYLTRTRVENAKRLLTNGRMSVSEVAREVGYDDAGYFSRVFKKLTGITPATYKK